ncbi:MAG: dephospho-CoA kinase, partial [Planctomycetota bacterium]
VARSFIAERVFGDSEEAAANRRFLEELVHPAVGRRLRAELCELRQQDVSAVVLDVPLLLEAGYAPDCDRLLFVDTPEPDRRERAAVRGWSAEEFAAREAAQRPISEKRSAATDTVANHGSSQDLALAVADFWRRRVVTAEP